MQLASLASLEDVVTHGLQSLFGDALWAHCVSLSRGAGSAYRGSAASIPLAFLLPKAAPGRSWGSILLSKRGPTGLSVKSCPAPLPDRSVSTHHRSGSPASAAGRAEPASPPCPSLAPRLLVPVRLLPGRLAEVAPQAPLRLGANGISTTPNDRCGARFSVVFSPVLQCGLCAPIPRPMTMSTTQATLHGPCLPMPTPRPPCFCTSRSWTSSWWVCLAGSPSTFSPQRSSTRLFPHLTFRLTIPDMTFGSELRPRPGSWRPARLAVHHCRLPLVACGSLEGSPQPEQSCLPSCWGGSLVLLRALGGL